MYMHFLDRFSNVYKIVSQLNSTQLYCDILAAEQLNC